ncbi:MAG: hypothetical protein PHW04_15855, partial [Candidatus Wallbacteria bacterium]|nr:hypothetical protein [Candidatus Wallbacteria bacterium]
MFAFLLAGCRQPSLSLDSKAKHPTTTADSSETSSPAYGDTLVEISLADVVTLNPVLLTDVPSKRVVNLIFSGLVREGEDLAPVPDLADTWEISANGLVLTFHLREG